MIQEARSPPNIVDRESHRRTRLFKKGRRANEVKSTESDVSSEAIGAEMIIMK
jgi:hypothetical protein